MNFSGSQHQELHPIEHVARAAGISTRTLRYYHQIDLLPPAYTAHDGRRHYDSSSLVRLQRILLLRSTGLELKTIAAILNDSRDEKAALQEHIVALEKQRQQLERKILTLHTTIRKLDKGETVELNESFEGFNDQYEEEVIERWGRDSFTQSNHWWKSLPETKRRGFFEVSQALIERWVSAGQAGYRADSPQAQELAALHVQWLRSIPGTPGHQGEADALSDYVRSLAQLYVTDERFAATYEGQAQFVHDALEHFLDHQQG